MEPVRLDFRAFSDLNGALEREWLETNGLGGFSCSTIVGLNTRRYHGLLTVAARPPVGRVLLLSKLEETLVVGGHRHPLSANQYPGTIHPDGYRYLTEFSIDPYPTFLYQVAGMEIEKRVFLVHGQDTVVIEYELRSLERDPAPECMLEVLPLVAFRDYHSTTHQNPAIHPNVEFSAGLATVAPYPDFPILHLAHSARSAEATGHWYLNFEYREEQQRGLDFREDLFNPLVLRFSFDQTPLATIIASTAPHSAAEGPILRLQELNRREALADLAPHPDPFVTALTAAADQFIVDRGKSKTIVAGYPWFSDWGRDAMIALPGLTLTTGRFEVARDILRTFAAAVDRGMLPNRFPDAGETPEYNTVDATLWFFEAARAYVQHTGDFDFVRTHLYGCLKGIVNWHLAGTRYGICVDSDGLLMCGEPGVQLTWMDAKVGDWVVTPRSGKPVEIQALWYNALRILEQFSDHIGDAASTVFLRELAELVRRTFRARFCNDDTGCLYDVIDSKDSTSTADPSIRPNQIFAVSLAHPLLDGEMASQVVDVVRRNLLTPMGIRTLAPSDPAYRGVYRGGIYERDSAYHQGTVWPWLLGPFLTAYLRVNGRNSESLACVDGWLSPLAGHLRQAGLGQISEVADGDAPHHPGGCFAQAWSVAEILRVLVEEVRSPDLQTGASNPELFAVLSPE